MKEVLLRTARTLKQPGDASIKEFGAQWETLAARGTQIFRMRPDVDRLIGRGNEPMAEDNNRNFPRFMASLFLAYQPEVFVDTVLWVFRTYRAHGFHTDFWTVNLNLWVDLLKKELSPETFIDIQPFYNWLMVNVPLFVTLTDLELSDQGHISALGSET